jgi:hypothetical protein
VVGGIALCMAMQFRACHSQFGSDPTATSGICVVPDGLADEYSRISSAETYKADSHCEAIKRTSTKGKSDIDRVATESSIVRARRLMDVAKKQPGF